VTRAELGDRWAGVIYSDEKCEVLYKIRAPPLTPSRRLGDQSSGASSSPSVHMLRIPSRGRSVPRCATHNASGRHMRMLTSRCGRGLALLCSAHPHEPRVWGDIEKVYSCPRCHEEIPSATTAGITRVTRATTTRAPTVTTSGSVRSSWIRRQLRRPKEPAQGDNQPKRVKVAANNVANRVVDWVRVSDYSACFALKLLLCASCSSCSTHCHTHTMHRH
jgi:hypothetical protein